MPCSLWYFIKEYKPAKFVEHILTNELFLTEYSYIKNNIVNKIALMFALLSDSNTQSNYLNTAYMTIQYNNNYIKAGYKCVFLYIKLIQYITTLFIAVFINKVYS